MITDARSPFCALALTPAISNSTRPLDEPDSFSYTFDKREFSFHSQESLQRRLEEIEDQFEKGKIIPSVRAKMQELERLLSQGRLSRGFFELLKNFCSDTIIGDF